MSNAVSCWFLWSIIVVCLLRYFVDVVIILEVGCLIRFYCVGAYLTIHL